MRVSTPSRETGGARERCGPPTAGRRATGARPGNERKRAGKDQRHTQPQRQLGEPLIELQQTVQGRNDEPEQERGTDRYRGDEDQAQWKARSRIRRILAAGRTRRRHDRSRQLRRAIMRGSIGGREGACADCWDCHFSLLCWPPRPRRPRASAVRRPVGRGRPAVEHGLQARAGSLRLHLDGHAGRTRTLRRRQLRGVRNDPADPASIGGNNVHRRS